MILYVNVYPIAIHNTKYAGNFIKTFQTSAFNFRNFFTVYINVFHRQGKIKNFSAEGIQAPGLDTWIPGFKPGYSLLRALTTCIVVEIRVPLE